MKPTLNKMKYRHALSMAPLFLVLVLILSSCSDSKSSNEDGVEQLISEVRAATQNFQNFEAGIQAGWHAALSPCVEHPVEGGMGFHYGRPEYIDGRVNHLQPQILLYEPQEDGGMELLGVEYIVPFNYHPADAEPPELFGEHFHPNHAQGFWALHVWTERENPKGMFYDWNPNVSCQYETNFMIAQVRSVTAEYHDYNKALADGWSNQLSPCVEHPDEGGMGYHYGRMEYFDGRTNHLEPQILLYEPLENGNKAFIGVEYVVPFSHHPADADPPMLFGEHYHPNHAQNFWALHVWTERDNPRGMFYDWNPNVSCQHAND